MLGAVELTGSGGSTAGRRRPAPRRDRPRRRRRHWAEIQVPGHWRNHPEFADHDGPLLHRRRFTAPEPEPRPPALGDARRDLLPGRRLARRRLPRRPRGLLPPAHVRHHRAVADRRRARAGGRGGVPAATRCTAASARSPACSSTGMASTATGTPADCGARCASTTPARCGSTGSACCAATPTRRGRTCCFYARLDCDDRAPCPRPHARRRPS